MDPLPGAGEGSFSVWHLLQGSAKRVRPLSRAARQNGGTGGDQAPRLVGIICLAGVYYPQVDRLIAWSRSEEFVYAAASNDREDKYEYPDDR